MITSDQQEIENLRQGGKILARVLDMVVSKVKPGISAFELDKLAEQEIRNAGAVPSFKGYKSHPQGPPFPATLCVSKNDEVVHGLPLKDKILNDGDIVGLDIGLKFKGLYTDMAITVPVGRVESKHIRLIAAAKECLAKALEQALPANYTGDIGFAIESTAKKSGFSVVKDLVGHGVGKEVHEDPEVPCYGPPRSGTKLVAGMVLAIEPMINVGTGQVHFADDKWTVKTNDGSFSAHMEHTVLITDKGAEIITTA
ncbi:MAG TPA: type I methionyl aminopeptidase [Patescibacteria group bacterium]|jgi:methionyl aminopeptidase|nr:type I methionyl aminopeptidase [Patescibacteria group bacterium]